MKIDFLGRYREIAKYVEASAQGAERVPSQQGFENTIGSLLGDSRGIAENKGLSPRSITQESSLNAEMMGRLNLPQASLQLPEIDSQIPFIPAVPEVEAEQSGVKTPSVLSVRRINESGEVITGTVSQRISYVHDLVEQAGAKFGIDPALGLAVVKRESSFNPTAVSSDGHASKGLFQLLDRTGKDLLSKFGMTDPYDPFDPQQNVYLGVGYLRRLHDLFSAKTDLPNNFSTVPAANSTSLEKLAVAAFNAGEGRVASAQQRAKDAGKDPSEYAHVEAYLPDTTKEYVAKVIEAKADYKTRISAQSGNR